MAKFLIKVQSVSDIITNSSSEVFISQKNDALMNVLKEWNIDYNCYETEEELRKAVEEEPYEFDEITTYNPYYNYCLMEDLQEMKSKDNIWEFFKQFYTGLIGKIIINVDRDYLYRQEQKFGEFLTKYIKDA